MAHQHERIEVEHIAIFPHIRLPDPPIAEWTQIGLFWPERLSVPDWAERSIVLSSAVTSEPGRLSLDRTPYLRGILESFSNPAIEEIVLVGSTQWGKTLSLLLMLGYAVDQDPGPALFVTSKESSAREMGDERVVPIFQSTPALRTHLRSDKYDTTKLRVRFDRMTLHLGWAGSPSELASRPKRYLFFDEVDKYPVASGNEADPIKLGKERARTYRNAKAVIASTPTIANSNIDLAWQRSMKHEPYVCCPGCGRYQVMRFPQIKFDKEIPAEQIAAEDLAHYECEFCERQIKTLEKQGMVAGVVWCPEGCTVGSKGEIIGTPRHSRSHGFWINCFYSPWITLGKIAAEFLTSKDEPSLLMNFVNSWLAENWEERADGMEVEIDQYYQEVRLGIVPDSAIVLLAGCDVQEDYIRYVVRAWLPDEESILIEEGRFDHKKDEPADVGHMRSDFQQLEDCILGGTWPTADGRDMPVRALAIDAQHRTDEVFVFARKHPDRAFAVRGSSQEQMTPYRFVLLDKLPGGRRIARKHTIKIWSLNTGHYKNTIARLRQQRKFNAHSEVSAAYQREFNSEHRIVEVVRGGRQVEKWVVRKGARANHVWDCEVYGVALADILGYWRQEGIAEQRQAATSWFAQQRRN